MPEEFMSFDQAREELGISEQELKQMMDEGKLRSFRDGQQVKFRAKEIHELSGKGAPEEVAEAEAIPTEEAPSEKEGEEALESIFGEGEEFDIAPLEEDEEAATVEAPKETEEAPSLLEEAPEEEIETIGEEAAVEEVPTLKEEERVQAAEPLEELEELEEVEEITPEVEEFAPIEEIEEKGEELSAAEMKSLAPRRVKAVTPSPFATAVLVLATVFLVFTAFVIVNAFAQPGQSFTLLEKITDFFASR
jgi:hypothetical protein